MRLPAGGGFRTAKYQEEPFTPCGRRHDLPPIHRRRRIRAAPAGRPFAYGDLLEHAADVWPLTREDSDPGEWARAFLEAGPGGQGAAPRGL